MQIRINESGEIKELTITKSINGINSVSELLSYRNVWNDEGCGYDKRANVHYMPQKKYNYWEDWIFMQEEIVNVDELEGRHKTMTENTNTNPTLLIGLVIKHFREIKPGLVQTLELRVYDKNGSGYYFVREYTPGTWYYKEATNSDHFRKATEEDVAAIQGKAMIQVTGHRSLPLEIWTDWDSFWQDVS